MSELKITTNGHWHEPVSFYDLPVDQQAWFDYVDGEDRYSPRFIRYRGAWADLNEFYPTAEMQADGIHSWHAYQSDSCFSGLVIRYSEDYERVQVGTYTS